MDVFVDELRPLRSHLSSFAEILPPLIHPSEPMPAYLYLLVAFGTAIWVTPFFLAPSTGERVVKIDKRGRWGVLLQCLAYSVLWQGRFWEEQPAWWRVAASASFFALGCGISWTAPRALGRQFRFEAALDSAHTLVRSGPYRYVRHPIYSSMLCIILATGFVISDLRLMTAAIAIFMCGALIRMRIEDGLLASRFGKEFADYRRRVPGILPFSFYRNRGTF